VGDRLHQSVAAETQVVVALDVPHLHQPDQPGLFHGGMRLHKQNNRFIYSLLVDEFLLNQIKDFTLPWLCAN